jgi:hypothetical protein
VFFRAVATPVRTAPGHPGPSDPKHPGARKPRPDTAPPACPASPAASGGRFLRPAPPPVNRKRQKNFMRPRTSGNPRGINAIGRRRAGPDGTGRRPGAATGAPDPPPSADSGAGRAPRAALFRLPSRTQFGTKRSLLLPGVDPGTPTPRRAHPRPETTPPKSVSVTAPESSRARGTQPIRRRTGPAERAAPDAPADPRAVAHQQQCLGRKA